MNMIWQQIRYDSENCHDNNLMTKPWWLRYDDCARLGFDPGSRSCHSPSTPSHSLCDQTSANCISSLMLKCICNQHELYFFTHAQVYLCTGTNCISSFMINCIGATVQIVFFKFMMKFICATAQIVFFHSCSSVFLYQHTLYFFHSCSSVFVTSTNCISSLMLKCIWHQRKLNLFFHDQVHLCDSANCIFYSWWSVFV